MLPEPRSLLEPTCGIGNFLRAGLAAYPDLDRALGLEIQSVHLHAARDRLTTEYGPRVEIRRADIFDTALEHLLPSLPPPTLVFGNPPWVTNAQLGRIGSARLPEKRNTDALRGMDALTGKSNFDVSEWITRRFLDLLAEQELHLGLLVKASVARKALSYAWKKQLPVRSARFHRIDAGRAFKVAVDAGLLIIERGSPSDQKCSVYADLSADASPAHEFGWRDDVLIADLDAYLDASLLHRPSRGKVAWRSGIKHDCAQVLELTEREGRWVNGLGEIVEVEDDMLYPLLKSSDLARGREPGRRRLVVPQRKTSQDTTQLRTSHPQTWNYLMRHAARLDARKSSIYRDRSRFAIFGVGEYSFAPWKVSVSAMYQPPSFRLLGPVCGRPVVLDDTCYFLGFDRQEDARRVHDAMSSRAAHAFFRAFCFADSKRPITAEILRKLDIDRLLELSDAPE